VLQPCQQSSCAKQLNYSVILIKETGLDAYLFVRELSKSTIESDTSYNSTVIKRLNQEVSNSILAAI